MEQLRQIFSFKAFLFLIAYLLGSAFLIAYFVHEFENYFYETLFVAFLSLCVASAGMYFFYVKKLQKVLYDLDQVTVYLEGLNDKNYESVLQTKCYAEFLHIELLLKNLVKRLHKKEKKN